MSTTSLRTQIILPSNLRQAIEKVRSRSGESLGEYLRQAAEQRLVRERAKRQALRQLAQQVVGSVTQSAWLGTDVVKWQRRLRRDRD